MIIATCSLSTTIVPNNSTAESKSRSSSYGPTPLPLNNNITKVKADLSLRPPAGNNISFVNSSTTQEKRSGDSEINFKPIILPKPQHLTKSVPPEILTYIANKTLCKSKTDNLYLTSGNNSATTLTSGSNDSSTPQRLSLMKRFANWITRTISKIGRARQHIDTNSRSDRERQIDKNLFSIIDKAVKNNDTDGLFRLSPSQTNLDAARKALNKSGNITSKIKHIDRDSAASLIKERLGNLSPITREQYCELEAALKSTSPDKKVAAIFSKIFSENPRFEEMMAFFKKNHQQASDDIDATFNKKTINTLFGTNLVKNLIPTDATPVEIIEYTNNGSAIFARWCIDQS